MKLSGTRESDAYTGPGVPLSRTMGMLTCNYMLWVALIWLALCSATPKKREAFDGEGVIVPEVWPSGYKQHVPREPKIGGKIDTIQTAQEIDSALDELPGTRTLQAIPVTAAPTMAPTRSVCNLDSFNTWKGEPYVGILLTDPSFWRYQTQLQFQLSNGLALDLAVSKCKEKLLLLSQFKAGKTGPVDIQNIYKAMCKDECLQSDIMHVDAMTYTGCSCLELSTNATDLSFRVEGDWCLHNSARLLCDLLGFCGIWGCRIDDFMCPRYEWNKKLIPLKGLGNCDRTQYTGGELKAASSEAVSAAPRAVNTDIFSLTLGLAAAVATLLWL